MQYLNFAKLELAHIAGIIAKTLGPEQAFHEKK